MSCTDACLWMGDCESGEFGSEDFRRARKPYKCCECRDVIPVGAEHHYCAGKHDGTFWYERTCLACHEIRTTFSCDGYALTCLWESVGEQMFPEWDEMKAIDCLARLRSQAAIDKMRAKYTEWKEKRTARPPIRRRHAPNTEGK